MNSVNVKMTNPEMVMEYKKFSKGTNCNKTHSCCYIADSCWSIADKFFVTKHIFQAF